MKVSTIAWVLLAVTALALAWQLRVMARLLEASRIANRVEMLTVEAGNRGTVPVPLMQRNLEQLARASTLDPANVLIPVLQGGQHVLMGNGEPAIDAYNAALALEPRAEVYLNLGRAQRLLGLEDEAETSFRRSIDLDHNNRKMLRPYLKRRKRLREAEANADEQSARFLALRRQVFEDGFESGDFSGWKSIRLQPARTLDPKLLRKRRQAFRRLRAMAARARGKPLPPDQVPANEPGGGGMP